MDGWNPQHLNERQILRCFTMLALGVWYLHSVKIIHKDIKPENIFVYENGIFKLGDFGLSIQLNMNSQLRTRSNTGTRPYMSPEQHTMDEATKTYKITSQTDAWSLGSVLYELIIGRRAFADDNDANLAQKIKFDEVPPMGETASKELVELTMALLRKDPRLRATLDQVLASKLIVAEIYTLAVDKVIDLDFVRSIPHFDKDVLANIEQVLGLNIGGLRLEEEEEKKGGDYPPVQQPLSMNQLDIPNLKVTSSDAFAFEALGIYYTYMITASDDWIYTSNGGS